MKIGILIAGHIRESLQDYAKSYDVLFEKLLTPFGFEITAWPVIDGVFPPDIHAADGWILSGSIHGAYDNLPWFAPLADFIRNAYDAGVPMTGICFGHQFIAQTLGGTVEKFQGGWSVGVQDYDIYGEKVTLNAWHQDQVTQAPPDATVIGSSDFCRVAALAYGNKVLSFQPHPEFDTQFVNRLFAHHVPASLSEAQKAAIAERLSAPTDSARIAGKIAEFFLQHRKVFA